MFSTVIFLSFVRYSCILKSFSFLHWRSSFLHWRSSFLVVSIGAVFLSRFDRLLDGGCVGRVLCCLPVLIAFQVLTVYQLCVFFTCLVVSFDR